MSKFTDEELARKLIACAKRIMAEEAAENEVEDIDPKMSEKLRTLRPLLPKLNSKRNKTLKQMGIQKIINPNQTRVEDLIDMITGMLVR